MSDQSSPKPKHRWLHWIGIGPRDPDAWVPVDSSGGIIDGNLEMPGRLASELEAEGIETLQRTYVMPDDNGWSGSVPDASDRVRVALLVHRRDVERAKRLMTNLEEFTDLQNPPLSDDELTELAREAGHHILLHELSDEHIAKDLSDGS